MTARRCWNPRPHTVHEWRERGVRFDCDGRPFQRVASRSAAEPQTGSATPETATGRPSSDLYDRLTDAFHQEPTFGHSAVDAAAECGHCRAIVTALTAPAAGNVTPPLAMEIAADYARCTVALHFDPDHLPALIALFPDRADQLHHTAAQVEAEVEARILEQRDRHIGGRL